MKDADFNIANAAEVSFLCQVDHLHCTSVTVTEETDDSMLLLTACYPPQTFKCSFASLSKTKHTLCHHCYFSFAAFLVHLRKMLEDNFFGVVNEF